MEYEFWLAGIQGVAAQKKNQTEGMHENSGSDLLYRRNTITPF